MKKYLVFLAAALLLGCNNKPWAKSYVQSAVYVVDTRILECYVVFMASSNGSSATWVPCSMKILDNPDTQVVGDERGRVKDFAEKWAHKMWAEKLAQQFQAEMPEKKKE